MKIKHFLGTRFNVGLYDIFLNKIKTSPKAWMEHRIRVFKKYCLPSVMNQTDMDFAWIILFDEQTLAIHTEQLKELDGWTHKIFVKSNRTKIDRMKFIKKKSIGYDYIITTRLDNDDYLEPDMIESVKKEAIRIIKLTKLKKFSINPTFGRKHYLGNNQRVMADTFSNPFQSFVEKNIKKDTDGVWSRQHTEMSEYVKVFQLKNKVYWNQTIHRLNLINR